MKLSIASSELKEDAEDAEDDSGSFSGSLDV